MALSDDAKRRAVSAVSAVRDDIHRVITVGTTGYDIFGQPHYPAQPEPLEIPWVERWRDTQKREAVIEEVRGRGRDVDAPGE